MLTQILLMSDILMKISIMLVLILIHPVSLDNNIIHDDDPESVTYVTRLAWCNR